MNTKQRVDALQCQRGQRDQRGQRGQRGQHYPHKIILSIIHEDMQRPTKQVGSRLLSSHASHCPLSFYLLHTYILSTYFFQKCADHCDGCWRRMRRKNKQRERRRDNGECKDAYCMEERKDGRRGGKKERNACLLAVHKRSS